MKLDKARERADKNEIDEMVQYMRDHVYCEVPSCFTLLMGNHPHRIVSAGAGGKYTIENMIRLCSKHHSEAHKIGNLEFAKKYGIQKIFDVLSKG